MPHTHKLIAPETRRWSWWFRLWESSNDYGMAFTMQWSQVRTPVLPIGPLYDLLRPLMIPTQAFPTQPSTIQIVQNTTLPETDMLTITKETITSQIKPPVPTDTHYDTVLATYSLLNSTNTNLTDDSWLYREPRPPFYRELGLLVT